MKVNITSEMIASVPHPKKNILCQMFDQIQKEVPTEAYQALIDELSGGNKTNYAVLTNVAREHPPFFSWLAHKGVHEGYALCEMLKFSTMGGKTYLISDSACEEIVRTKSDNPLTFHELTLPHSPVYLAFGRDGKHNPVFVRDNGGTMRFEGIYLSEIAATNLTDAMLPDSILSQYHPFPTLPYRVIEACFVASPIVGGVARAEMSLIFGSLTLRVFSESITLSEVMLQSHDIQNQINTSLLATVQSLSIPSVEILEYMGGHDANEERYIRSLDLAMNALKYITSGQGTSVEVVREKDLEDRVRRTKGCMQRKAVHELLTTYDHILITPKTMTHAASSSTH